MVGWSVILNCSMESGAEWAILRRREEGWSGRVKAAGAREVEGEVKRSWELVVMEKERSRDDG